MTGPDLSGMDVGRAGLGQAGRRGAPLVVVGDVMLDRDLVGVVKRVAPDAPAPVVERPRELLRPGGAGLAALLAARAGHEVVLVTPLGADPVSELVRSLLADTVEVIALPTTGRPEEKVRVRAGAHVIARLDVPGGGRVREIPDQARRALAQAGTILVSDYGRGVLAHPQITAALAHRGRARLVWDPHPRGPAPVPGASLVTPNLAEARGFCAAEGGEPAQADERSGERPELRVAAGCAQTLAARWRASAVAVTLGAHGALVTTGAGPPLVAPARPFVGGDPCGAGDQFAAAAAGLLHHGALITEAVVGAVAAATGFVASGGAGAVAVPAGADTPPSPLRVATAPVRPPDLGADADGEIRTDEASDDGKPPGRREAARLAARVRRSGGTVVATGGCFDVLHAGHVALLRAARALGDTVIVLLNSDESVRGLKGPRRPVNPVADRIAVLRSLAFVDAVAVFDESTPHAALAELRPHVWVKGGDYAAGELPEAALLSSWGGQAVLVPYVAGRSTTAIVRALAR